MGGGLAWDKGRTQGKNLSCQTWVGEKSGLFEHPAGALACQLAFPVAC